MPTMPNVVGLGYPAAQLSLQQAGVFVPVPVFAFQPAQITTSFVRSAQVGGTVTAQSPASGNTVAAGAPLTLTLAEFPVGVAFP